LAGGASKRELRHVDHGHRLAIPLEHPGNPRRRTGNRLGGRECQHLGDPGRVKRVAVAVQIEQEEEHRDGPCLA
jgi:hypothetical protein